MEQVGPTPLPPTQETASTLTPKHNKEHDLFQENLSRTQDVTLILPSTSDCTM